MRKLIGDPMSLAGLKAFPGASFVLPLLIPRCSELSHHSSCVTPFAPSGIWFGTAGKGLQSPPAGPPVILEAFVSLVELSAMTARPAGATRCDFVPPPVSMSFAVKGLDAESDKAVRGSRGAPGGSPLAAKPSSALSLGSGGSKWKFIVKGARGHFEIHGFGRSEQRSPGQ